jgi:hypothetical protein
MVEMDSTKPEERLVIYGSLAPGGANNFMFTGVEGNWHKCVIRGRMGRWRGFKSFKYDPAGEEHEAWLFESPVLPQMYPDLDDFEGEEYHRTLIPVQVGDLTVMAHIYEGKYCD